MRAPRVTRSLLLGLVWLGAGWTLAACASGAGARSGDPDRIETPSCGRGFVHALDAVAEAGDEGGQEPAEPSTDSGQEQQEKRPPGDQHGESLERLVEGRPDDLQAARHPGPQGQRGERREGTGARDVLVARQGDTVAGRDQPRLDEEGAVPVLGALDDGVCCPRAEPLVQPGELRVTDPLRPGGWYQGGE